MCWIRKKEGFTLIELLIVILTGTIVTAAATTILLLAFRINRKSMDTVGRQSIMRIMHSVLEDMSSNEEFELVYNAKQNENGDVILETDPANNVRDFWSINKEDPDNENNSIPIITYNPPSLSNGVPGRIVTNGQTLVDNVTQSILYKPYAADPFDYIENVYTFSIEIQGNAYNTTIYNRTQDENWGANDPLLDYESGRNEIVSIASSQVGSTGRILDMSNRRLKEWYTEWYVDECLLFDVDFYPNASDSETWNPSTPWCSTFASWVINQCSEDYLPEPPAHAAVNYLWLYNFAYTSEDNVSVNDSANDVPHVPNPGDLIFFEYGDEEEDLTLDEEGNPIQDLDGLKDLTEDNQELIATMLDWDNFGFMVNWALHAAGAIFDEDYILSPDQFLELPLAEMFFYEPFDIMVHGLGIKGDGLDHVGIVVDVDDDYVYTIEGNVSIEENSDVTKKVMIRKYEIDDPEIFGYAQLGWNPDYQ